MATATSKERFHKETIVIIDKLLLLGCVLGAIIVAATILNTEGEIKLIDLYSDIASLVIMLSIYFSRNWLALTTRVYIIISIVFAFVIIDQMQYGMLASDRNFIVLIPFLSILFLTPRITIALSSIVFSIYLSIGYLISTNIIHPLYQNDNGEFNFVDWIDSSLVLGLISFIIALFVYRFDTTMFKLFKNLEEKNQTFADREYLLTRITNNIPRTQVTVYNRNLELLFFGGRVHPNQVPFQVGDKLDEIFDQYLDEDIKLELIDSYWKTFSGQPQVGNFTVKEFRFSYKTVPLYNLDGEISSILSVSEDITDRVKKDRLIQENLEEKNVLLAEIHHRVKNNLAVVSGLLELQSYHISDPETKFMLRKSTNRIMSIAKVHELLYESQNFNKLPFDKYVDQLSQIILASMNNDNQTIAIETNIRIKNININHGVPLGIIFNELITNSVKYGFSGRANNTISICVKPDGSNIQVIYADNGRGISDFESQKKNSLGFTLIEQLMAQIEADFHYETSEHFKLTFSFPAASGEGPYQTS